MRSERSWGLLGMSSDKKEYFIVFDTNILFQPYEKKADFTSFSFNATYKNVIDMVNQLDIYEKVTIAIPEVTWNEMKKQIIEAHDKKIIEFEAYFKKWILPEYSVNRVALDDYSTYITEKLHAYQEEIKSGINKVIMLPIPSDNRFKGIVKRAFDKVPPFGGKEKNSDKGFKDVLIWESVLEFVLSHRQADIIFYTKDNGFKETLIEEFIKLNPQSLISICSSEDEIKGVLEKWAKEIDIYTYQPIETYSENSELIKWLESPDFEIQMIERDYGLIEKNRLISSTYVKLLSYNNISVINESENTVEYNVDATLEIGYSFKGSVSVKEKIDIVIIVECILGEIYSIEDAYRSDVADASEDESGE